MTGWMTGARPTGGLHIGHYFAAFEPFVNSGELDDSFFIVSDLHMLTTKFTPDSTKGMRRAIHRLVAEAIGFGIDPEVTTFYLQSQVQWQARIYVILQSLAPIDSLTSQVSFTDMSRTSVQIRKPTLGLLGYPVLESSDVVSLRPSYVTVGEYNVGHFQLLSEMLDELRTSWGYDFPQPQVVVGRPNLVGLDGTHKMGKSSGNAIMFADTPDEIAGKVADMTMAGPNGVVPTEYLRTLGESPERCAQLEEQLRADPQLPPALARELTDRLVSLVEPIAKRIAVVIDDASYIEGLLAAGCAKADELGEAAYRELTQALDMPRVWQR